MAFPKAAPPTNQGNRMVSVQMTWVLHCGHKNALEKALVQATPCYKAILLPAKNHFQRRAQESGQKTPGSLQDARMVTLYC